MVLRQVLRTVLRWVGGVAAVLAVVAAVTAGIVVSGVLRGPRVDGTLVVPGLAEPVEVLRDAHGIPYVFARSLPDLIRAQGFVTAQARLFQMEAYRALALGRLAEVVGSPGLESDREMRRLGIRRNAERHAARLSPAARQFLGWYAEGLNAYILRHADDHPVELRIAGFRPQPWTLEDMVTVLHFASLQQAANYRAELLLQRIVEAVGPDRARELAPVNVNPDRTRPLEWLAAVPAPVRLGPEAPALLALGAAPAPPLLPGSNNWAIAPARSASGAAVVVNDPHLDARLLPGVWMPVGLFAPEVRAVGAALPAMPGILLGRTADVAFGITNAYGDSQDLYVERFAPGDIDHYIDGDRIRPFEKIVETFRVRDPKAPGGMREEALVVRRTVRGPLLGGKLLGPERDRALSLRMATAEVEGGDLGLDALLLARSAADVDRAVQQIEVLYLNFVFADTAGVIGHRASGRVPIRRSGQGVFPQPVTGEDDWVGVIPPDRMPGLLAPARGWVATANHDTRPDGYPYEYSSYFSPPYRYERIAQVLDSARGMTVANHVALLLDTQNLQVPRLLPAILAALRDAPEHADFLAILSAWDGRDRADAPAPLLYQYLYRQVALETFADDLGADLVRAYLAEWYLWQGRFDALVATPASPWFDDRTTPAVETLPDIVRRAAGRVRNVLAAGHGRDPARWRWGDAHRLRFDSPLRRQGIGRSLLGRRPRPYDGSGETVLRARSAFGDTEVAFFASMRLVADLADDEKVLAVVSGGVVERQFHPHQADQLEPWFAGELLPWWFSRAAVERNARHRQVLVPAGGDPGGAR